jgi:hypothetical protein
MLVERTPCQTPRRATVSPPAVAHRIAPERKIQIVSKSHSTISGELAHARRAWVRYRSTRQRDAVYGYLNAVFEIVRHWETQQRAKVSSRQALVATRQRRVVRIDEPFATVIFCTSDPEIADAKTGSKRSRVLRFARRAKPGNQRLTSSSPMAVSTSVRSSSLWAWINGNRTNPRILTSDALGRSRPNEAIGFESALTPISDISLHRTNRREGRADAALATGVETFLNSTARRQFRERPSWR